MPLPFLPNRPFSFLFLFVYGFAFNALFTLEWEDPFLVDLFPWLIALFSRTLGLMDLITSGPPLWIDSLPCCFRVVVFFLVAVLVVWLFTFRPLPFN